MSEMNMNIPAWRKVTLTKEEAAAYSHISVGKQTKSLRPYDNYRAY